MKSNLSWQHCSCIQMSKGCSRSRICQVISRHIDSLDRGNWTLFGCCNTLLKTSKISRQSWLVTDSRWDTTKQSRHLWVSLHDTPQCKTNNYKTIHRQTIKDIFNKQGKRHTWVKRKMLSTKRSTSCPSASRKCSATVSPVRPTRARAPGGSFIWPYTRAHLLSL